MKIKRSDTRTSGEGSADWFTGSVRIEPMFEAPEPARVRGASVTSEAGARTGLAHPSAGTDPDHHRRDGSRADQGGPIEEVHPGDVIWFPPNDKHWQGASPTTAMTHLAIQEALDGKVVEWMEKVTDEQ